MPHDDAFAHYPADRNRNRGRRYSDRLPTKGKVNWSALGVIVTLAMILLTAILSVSNRVTSLETQSRNDSQRMERVENKLDRLLERVK